MRDSAAAATQSENTVKFTMRFRSDLNTAMRLIHDGDAWNMTSIINVKGRNREALIMAKRIE
ncbi:MAG: phage head closure protein [Luteimonas sp.]